jgi:PAS domain S-box-containing protein
MTIRLRTNAGAPLWHYGGAALAVGLATAVRLLLDPVLEDRAPFFTYLLAILVVARYGGLGPALAALALSWPAVAYFILEPRGSFAIDKPEQQEGFVLFTLVGIIVAVLGGSLRSAQRRAERQARHLATQRELLHVTLASIGDAVLATDAKGQVTFLNAAAQTLTGWGQAEAEGQQLDKVFTIRNEQTRQPADNPVARVLRKGAVVGLGNHTILVRKDGTQRPIDDSAAPIRGGDGTILGVVLVFRDVSERRKLESLQRELQSRLEQQVQERTAQLRQSEERFRLLVEGTTDYAIYLLDPEGRIASWNPGAQRIKGYRADEIIGHPYARFFTPEDIRAGKPQQTLSAAASSGRHEEEGWRVRKDGSRFWASAILTALRDEAGNLRGFSKITRDLTQRKQAEEDARRLAQEQAARQAAEASAEEIRAQREQLRVTLESIGDAVLVTDHEGRVTLLNPVAEALTGWTKAEAAGLPLAQIFRITNEQTGRGAENPVERVLREGVVVGLANHTVLTGRDGSRRPIDDSAAPIRDGRGNLTGVVMVFRDVTQRRRAEQTARFLADASAALAGLVDYESTLRKVARLAVPFFADWCAVDMAGEDGSIRRLAAAHVDPAKVELAHELHRRFPTDPQAPRGVGHILRTGQAELISEITDALLAETVKDRELLRILRELGLKSYIGVPLEVRGRVLGVLTFIAAESGRRYDANDLAVAQDLAHRAAVAIENARLYHDLREADRRKDEFLAMLAHELRNPLAPIRNSLEVLRVRRVNGDAAERAREMMARQVQHLVRLVDDLLDVSRIMRGKIELRKERVELHKVVERAVETAHPALDAQGHALTVSLPPEPIWLEADPIRLAQVVANLLNNAAKYTEKAGQVALTVERHGGEVVLRVKDTGIGIAPEMLPRLFELFMQAERSLARSQGGLGIGLALVKKLVEMHGGRVSASSAGPGKGSEFTIRLPVLPAHAGQEAKAPAPGPVQTPERLRVLVVDDNVDAAESLAMVLRFLKQDVQVAHDGPSALEAARTYRPDFIILDIGLPGLSGHDVARELRQQPEFRETLLVAVTGYGQDEDRRRSQEAGFDLHLTKPVEPSDLEKLLRHPKVVQG